MSFDSQEDRSKALVISTYFIIIVPICALKFDNAVEDDRVDLLTLQLQPSLTLCPRNETLQIYPEWSPTALVSGVPGFQAEEIS
nr:hypothetical protein HmN_000086500 [Hymenolepis microstoma]